MRLFLAICILTGWSFTDKEINNESEEVIQKIQQSDEVIKTQESIKEDVQE